jgi:hypothetical protein
MFLLGWLSQGCPRPVISKENVVTPVANNHGYMLPVGAQVILRRGREETDLNEIEFGNFRRFGSNVKILDSIQEMNPRRTPSPETRAHSSAG